jgi:hypothetical protein
MVLLKSAPPKGQGGGKRQRTELSEAILSRANFGSNPVYYFIIVFLSPSEPQFPCLQHGILQ